MGDIKEFYIGNMDIFNNETEIFCGGESNLYLINGLLFKIYTEDNDSFREKKIKKLMKIDDLDDVAIIPKLMLYNDNRLIGYAMRYLENTDTIHKYFNNNIDDVKCLYTLKKMSIGLKKINSDGIKITDLHTRNVVIGKNQNPMYIDMDSTYIGELPSFHISVLIYEHYNINGDKSLKNRILANNNVDRETLFLLFLNFVMNIEVQKFDYYEFRQLLKELKKFLPVEMIKVIAELKRKNMDLYHFNHYLDSFIDEDVIISCEKYMRK